MPKTITNNARDDDIVPVKQLGWPRGINNILPENQIGTDALRSGTNVDVYDDGKLRRRRGSIKQINVASCHSLWSDPKLDFGLYAAGSTMYLVHEGLANPSAVVTGLQPNQPIAYQQLHGDVFWTNDIVSGRIRNGVNLPWGVETPSKNPFLSYSVGGGLYPGRYQVAITFRNGNGEESGANVADAITLVANGSITLSGFPVPVSSDVTHVIVYVSPCNGDVLQKIATLPIGTSSYTISNVTAATTLLKTQLMQEMVPGEIIAHHKGVLYVATGPMIYHTEPLRYGLINLNDNYYWFPSDITIMLAVPDGLYVCADKTYFISNPGTQEPTIKPIFNFGGVKGTGVYLPNSTDVAWQSPRGQMIGSDGGQAKIVTEKEFIPGSASSGAAIVREKEGLRQIINVVENVKENPLAYTGA